MEIFLTILPGSREAASKTDHSVQRSNEGRHAAFHPGGYPEPHRPGIRSSLSGVQPIPEPAAIWVAGQL